MSTKSVLKSIRAKLTNDEPEGALYEATQLLKAIGDKDPEAPAVLSFRALALTHLERIDEAEKSYQTALRIAPGHPLAAAGLKKLLVKFERWESLGQLLEQAVQSAYEEADAEKLVASLQELVELRQDHGPRDKLYKTLVLLLPSSPLITLVQTTPVPAGSYVPLPEPTYPAPAGAAVPEIPRPLPHVYHLAGSLSLTLYLLLRAQNEVHEVTEARVKAGRQSIRARSERDVRRQVDGEVLTGPWGLRMIDLLRDVAGHPAVEESVRREVEVQEFNYWRRLVVALPENGKSNASKNNTPAPASKPKVGGMMISASLPPKPSTEVLEDPSTPPLFKSPTASKVTKAEARDRANGLADGFVLLGVAGAAEDAWNWVIDGRDEPTIAYDLELLHKFAHTFPNSSLTDFIDDYCRLYELPLPEPEDEKVEVASDKASVSEEKVKYKRPKRGKPKENARARRKARRVAKRDGELTEDISEEEREELVASMTKLLERLGKSLFAHRVMARVAIQEEDWVNAIAYAEKGRKLVREVESERGIKLPHVHTSLDAALAVALVPYYPPKHHERSARLLSGVLKSIPVDYEARFALGQIKQAASDWEGARAEFQTLLDQGGDEGQMVAAREELGWCLVNEGKLNEGRDVLEEVVEVRDTRKEQEGKDDEADLRARAWWRLGRTEWMIGDEESRKHAEEWFMASLRADESFAASYTALGICYAEAHSPPDTERALKCFQKAFELDATEAEAARRLAFGYADDDEWALVRAIATRVMEGEGGVEGVAGGEVVNPSGRFAPKNGWAWKALGSTEMHYKKYPQAIAAYQVALRAEPEDASMWRMLGDAYVKSGRHMAGLKALQHALELDPTMWMAEYHIGEVHVQLGSYAEAIVSYKKVDEATGGKEIGVTAALAEATLALGATAAAGGFRERSRRAFHEAINYAAKVLTTERSHRAWGWKLIGDAALQLAEHEVEAEDIEATAAVLHPVLEHLVADDEDRRSAVKDLGHASNLLQAAPGPHFTTQAAIFAFAYRAHLLKNEHVAERALYDLACALQFLATISKVADIKTAATRAAISAVRLALERDATEERLWNALGVICASAGPQLAQHAFVVSLECYGKDPVVWTNLGFLYLNIDDRELANQCFLKAQTMDPDYARAWFGQAILAQRDGQHHDATGLFAHAFTLSAGSLLEADLALALGAFHPFLSPWPKDTITLQQPAFALQHYIHSRPRDALAKHLYALICERLNLADNAVDALEGAIALLEEEFEASESAEVEANYAVALVNLGRVRLAAGRYDAALEAFTSGEELIATSTEPRVTALHVQAHLGIGLAQYWLKNLDASLEAFQRALEGAKNDLAMTDELAVLLARTLWAVGDDDAREAAKTQLMECLEHDEPSSKVVAALGAVGLESKDNDLIDAAVAELKSSPVERRSFQDPSGWGDLVLFAHAIVQGDEDAAISALEAAAVANPTAGPRNRLAEAYVESGKTAAALALLDNHKDRIVSEQATADRLRGIAATLEGENTALPQRAALLEPWNVQNWEALAWTKRAAVEIGE